MAVAALREGRRVAVTANSHAAIQNLLRAIEDRAVKDGVTDWRGVYKGEGYESPMGLVGAVSDNKETYGDEFRLVAGTAWLMSCEAHRERFDVLFIDEAGQFSLANAVAAGTVAKGIVLLGDPQQLPQVNQASHPHGAGSSVLGHILGEHDVIPSDRGVFLGVSWRMHPDVCRFVSERSYDGRLRSTEQCAERRVDAPGRLSGAGLRTVAVEHEGSSQESAAEADAIAELCEELLAGGATVTDDERRTRALVADDLLVVAPYNLARRCIAARVPAGVRVGTVDKFQGQEAPVVFFAMTCSSGEDVPRGLSFLFDRNRLNVAISRAQCLAVLVHAPRLLDADCRSLTDMQLLDGACRFAEMASPLDGYRRATITSRVPVPSAPPSRSP
jgi:superfamily I DNA and/or RNA helicase